MKEMLGTHLLKAGLISRCLVGWIVFVLVVLAFAIDGNSDKGTFFRIGPHHDLKIFNIPVDTGWRYFVVVVYTSVSTVVRTLHQEVIAPWIVQKIQNDVAKDDYTRRFAFEVVIVDVLFRWFDWAMYMNILLAQCDLMVIEIVGNMATSMYTTKLYMAPSV